MTPVQNQHPDYTLTLPVWTQIRDVLSGSRKVKSRGVVYLPALTDQTDTEYDAYLTRANFVNLSGKVLQSLIGQIVKRPPVYDNIPEKYQNSITNKSESIYELLGLVAEELMAFARVGLFVDFMGDRAKIVMFRAEDIVDWDYDTQAGVLLEVTLREEIRDGDRFRDKYYRLYIAAGVYMVDSYFDDEQAEIETRIPTKDGVALDEIPFYMLTPKGMKFDIERSVFEDITDINLSHFRTSADLEQGRHFVSLPTPVVSGINEGTTLRIGSTVAWVLPDKDSRAYYLEFQGQGLKSLETALSEKQSQIALFSAKIIETTTKGSEAAETVRLRYASEAATLSALASVIERALNVAIKKVLWWESDDSENVMLTLVKDFLSTKLTAAEITAITNTYLEGTIDRDTFINNLVRGDIVSAARSNEEKDRDVTLTQNIKPAETVRTGAFDDIDDPQG